MASRSGPVATVFRIVFALPFLAGGVVGVVAAIQHGAVSSLIFGAIFIAAGGWQIVAALRARATAESKAKPMTAASLVGAIAPLVADYRTAGRRERSAAEVYAPILSDRSQPLPAVKTSRGTTLPVRLGLAPSRAAFMIAFCVFWNGISVPFFVGSIVAKAWPVAAFLSIFVIAGIAMVYGTAHKLLARMKVPRVEVSEEPVFLGDVLRVRVDQRGPATIARLQVDLLCRERVSYTVGTDTRTEEHDAFHVELLCADERRRLGFGESWTHDLETTIPPSAPHSFASANNAIAWLVRVRADIAGWPDYDETYELRVLPRIGA